MSFNFMAAIAICSDLIRETQIKTTMRYYPIPVRMVIIKKSTNNKCWRECGEKETLLCCWWEGKLIPPLWRTAWRFLKKLEIKLPYDTATPPLGIFPEEIITEKRHIYPNVHHRPIYDSQDMDAT